ncbi:macrophage mannose receptor 1-like, partial [Actinia tenebrosa]|uniref:Macrophage mannose receptor 1-like n=1 Tax=Actinia tenebrosa TaxID=6105 RepID=A0A6P8IK63_ACTTE
MLWKSLSSLVWVVFGCVYLCTEPTHSTSAGYVFQNGPYIYKVVLPKEDKRSWFEAEEICRIEESGNLLTIGDKKEGNWVNQLMHNLTKELDYMGKFWIGATDKRLRGVYEFVDGSPFKYREAPWAEGEPNRPPKKAFGHEYCISMDPNSGTPTWSDDDCFQSFGYICKSQEVPKRLKDNKRFGYAWEWNYYEYKFIPLPYDSMTWSEAELYCQEAESGHLLSIYNSEESEWVTERIRQIRQVLGFKGLWIGATDIFSKGSFKWTDRGPVNYTKWTEGAPKNTSLSRKPREACVAILADPEWGKWDEEFCINKMPFVCKTKKCKGKSDLAFIVDASGSVTEEGFKKAKEFMLKVMRGFQVTNNETHVGLIRFANDADVIFGLKKHHNVLELKKAIDDMLFVQGETHTEKALDLARTTLFSQTAGSRMDVPRIALVMTDGKSDSFRRTSQAAAKLKTMGVTIVTLGIGNGVDRKELIDMSTSEDYVLYVESYAALSKRVKEIRERVCDEIIRQGLIRQRALEEKARILAEKMARERARLLAQEKARRLELQRLSAKERARKLAELRRLQQERARKLAHQQRLDKEKKARQLAEKQRLDRERKLAEQRRRENIR